MMAVQFFFTMCSGRVQCVYICLGVRSTCTTIHLPVRTHVRRDTSERETVPNQQGGNGNQH